MAREDLIPFNQLTEEEQKKLAVKGGKASGKARAERKAFKEELKLLLEIINEDGESNNTKVSIALMERALKGDTKAFEVIRDTIGEKPKDEVGIINEIPIIIRGENELK